MAQQTINTPRETTHQRIAQAIEDLADKIVDTSSASNIDYNNTQSGLSATKVQGAIDELANEKVDKVTGKGLSTNDYTTEEKNKLAGIETGAQENIIESISVNGTPQTVTNKTVALTIMTNAVNDLVNYYRKSETYTQAEVDALISAIVTLDIKAVNTLPTTNISTTTIYLVPKAQAQTQNVKDEYINTTGTSAGWEKIGDTQIDLSNYVTTTALNTILADYVTTTALNTALANKVDKVIGKGLSTNDYTNEDKENVDTIPEILEDIEGAKTVDGEVITVSDAAPINAQSVVVNIEPVQDLHGYEKPWVGGAGKNLYPTYQNITHDNMTFTSDVQTGTVNITGTPAVSGWDYGRYVSIKLPVGKYICSCESNPNNAAMLVNWGPVVITSQGVEITVSDETDDVRLAWFVSSGDNVDYTITGLMLRLVTETDSTFEPYENVCPISGWDECKITRAGKNLLPMTVEGLKSANTSGTWSNNTFTTSGMSYTILTDNDNNVTGINVNGTTNTYPNFYTQNFSLSVGTYIVSVSTVRARLYKNGSPITDIQPNRTYELLVTNINDIYTYVIFTGATTVTNMVATPMIRLASIEDDTFEPYLGTDYTIDFGDTIYGGTLDATKGELVVEKGYAEFDGSSDEGWVKAGTVEQGFYIPIINMLKLNDYTDSIMCDKLPTFIHNYSTLYTQAIYGITGYNDSQSRYPNENWLYTRANNITEVNELKTWLSNNPLQVVYELATPYTIKLTPTQIKLLENTNTLYANCGDVELKYQPNNALGKALEVAENGYDAQIEYIEKGWTTPIEVDTSNLGTLYFSENVAMHLAMFNWIGSSIAPTGASPFFDVSDIITEHPLMDVSAPLYRANSIEISASTETVIVRLSTSNSSKGCLIYPTVP